MTQQVVVAEIKDGNLIITLPVKPAPSKSGKTLLVSSTGGNQPSLATFQGQTVTIGVNAWIKK